MSFRMTNRRAAARRSGSSLLEFTFVGIPLLFALVSVFEISRGMWIYNTLAHGVKQATRYAINHGNNCASPPNNCVITAGAICTRMKDMGTGLEGSKVVNIQLTSASRTLSFTTLTACMASTVVFPSRTIGPTTDVGGHQGNPVEIVARYQFDSSLSMFWPGAGPGKTFGRVYLGASAKEYIQH